MRLVKNARSAWRWFSVQAMAVAIALQGAWNAMLEITPDLAARIPAGAIDTLSVAVLILGVVGRLVDQGGNNA